MEILVRNDCQKESIADSGTNCFSPKVLFASNAQPISPISAALHEEILAHWALSMAIDGPYRYMLSTQDIL